MKFGENLYLRSVPQWSYYNLDYNGLKGLIKARTSNPPTEPVSIPGQGSSSDKWNPLEDELFPILSEEHDKPGEFIKSKYGEIERRLTDLERRVKHLQQSALASPSRQRIQQTRRYKNMVQDAEGLSEDIQQLARFANTQRQAFRKILKKYEKWTRSPGLRIRVERDMFNQSSDPLRPNLDAHLLRLSEASSTIRQIAQISPNRQAKDQGEVPVDQRSSAATLNSAFQTNSAIETAAAFASVPMGKSAGRATYWVHPDNLDEARVLMLRHMKPFQVQRGSVPTTPALSRTPSNLSVARRPPNETNTPTDAQAERQNVVLFDNLERFARKQSGATVGSSEAMEGHVPTQIALSGWWSDAADACVLLSDISPAAVHAKPQNLTIKRKDLPNALWRDAAALQKKKAQPNATATVTQEYLTQHRDVRPLAGIQSSKSLFAGIANSTEVGTWATLETDVRMSKFKVETVGQTVETLDDRGEAFPHAILEIRWEFSRIPELVRAFDSSHIAERVRGFSLEAHTVLTICKPDIPEPLWLPLLKKDIRKVPLPTNRSGKRRAVREQNNTSSSAMNTSAPSSTEGPSDSVFSNAAGPSSATSVYTVNTTSPVLKSSSNLDFPDPRKLKKKRKLYPRKLVVEAAPQRYWNEFDDGSELEDDAYAIYVNPDEEYSLPGVETVSKAFTAMFGNFSKGKRRVWSLFSMKSPKSDNAMDAERQPLLYAQTSSDPDLADSSDSESAVGRSWRGKKGKEKGLQRSRRMSTSTYSTIGIGRPLSARRQAMERTLFRSYVGLLGLSYVLLLISAILKTTGRKKAVVEVDIGVISGVLVSEACGVLAMGLLCMRKRRTISVMHQVAVGLAFAVAAVAGTLLLLSVAVGKPV